MTDQTKRTLEMLREDDWAVMAPYTEVNQLRERFLRLLSACEELTNTLASSGKEPKP